MENFTDKDDWFKEIYEVRVKDILNPVKDINETQDIGQMINGQFFTREMIDQKIQQRILEYNDLKEVVDKANSGLQGLNLTKHSNPEKISKMITVNQLIP